MADQQEDGVRRRLLEILEQRVGGVALEIVDRVDHHRAPGRHRGRGREQPLQAAHLVDADRAGELGAALLRQPLEPHQIGMAAGGGEPGGGMVVGHVEAGRVDRAPRPSASTRSAALSANSALPTPSGPASSQAWCSRPRIERGAEGGDRGVMAVERGHSRSSSAASRRAVTSSGLPPASITRKRSGSACGERAKRLGDAAMIVGAAAADQVGALDVAAAGAPARFGLGQLEQQGAVGKEAVAADLVQRADRVEAEPAGAALIGDRAVDEAVARPPRRRASSAGRIVRATWSDAGGGEQQGLGLGGPVLDRAAAAPRIASAPGLPPGSRVSTTSRPRARSAAASAFAWVDLPAPSPPSSVMKRPGHASPSEALQARTRCGRRSPPRATALSATSGMVWGGMSAVSTTRSAICWPWAIGARTGP